MCTEGHISAFGATLPVQVPTCAHLYAQYAGDGARMQGVLTRVTGRAPVRRLGFI